MKTNRRKGSAGFSIVELLTVLGIGMVITAMAIPRMTNTIADFKLKSNVSSLAGMMQQARMEAVRRNTTVGIQTATVSGKTEFYGDKDNDGSVDSGEPRFILPSGMTAPTSGFPSGLATSSVSGITTALTPPIRFNARGLACVGTSCTTPANGTGFIYYFRDTRPLGTNGWAAVTVTPAGRVKTWFWTGSAWK